MSLHIGNLSPHIHIGDLECVFRRFGRCSIRVKDKYGFVVYDYPASAEKALKTLRGTRICGEDLTLSWSKHQPHAMQRFGAGRMPYKQPYKKLSARENSRLGLGSNNRFDYGLGFKKADEGRTIGSSDLVDESIDYHPDDLEGFAGERDHSFLNDHGGFEDAEKTHLEDDRWEEQIVDPLHERYLENDIEFDRYEPCHSVGIHELDEYQSTPPLASSPPRRKSRERTGNFFHTKSQKNCYLCGEAGHKMRSCPLELKRPVPRSHARMGHGVDTVPLRHRESDWEPSTSRNRQWLLGHGDPSQLHNSPSGRKKEYGNKKRNRRDYESRDKNHLEKARGPSSPSTHSGYTSSRVQSPSKPWKKNSLSASLKSSPSRHSGSKTSSASLPLDLNGHQSHSSKNVLTESKNPVTNAGDLSHGNLFEEETLVRSGTCTGTGIGTGTSNSENILEKESETMTDLSEKDNNPFNSVSKEPHEMFEACAPQSDADDQFGNDLLPHFVRNSKNAKLMEQHTLASDTDIPVRSSASSLDRISTEEICMVLKHYGMQHPEENEKDLPVESYFGSARLWPWEMIYYRRLKKGPILAENYLRRVAQNEKLGIVDKYVRCSSGWDQLDEDDS